MTNSSMYRADDTTKRDASSFYVPPPSNNLSANHPYSHPHQSQHHQQQQQQQQQQHHSLPLPSYPNPEDQYYQPPSTPPHPQNSYVQPNHPPSQPQAYSQSNYFNPYQDNASPQNQPLSSSYAYPANSHQPPHPPVPNPVEYSQRSAEDGFYRPPQTFTPQPPAPQPKPVQPTQPSAQHAQHAQQNAPMSGVQLAMPFLLSNVPQLASNPNAINAVGAQLFQSFVPGAAPPNQWFGNAGVNERANTFLRVPKEYFAVNHRYVLRKLSLILVPFLNRVWARQRGMQPGQYEANAAEVATYLPPREDVNAPDLYIPLMAFCTYVLMVGFVFGVRNQFHVQVLAKYFSKGLGVLSLEVLVIKLGLYLINARPTPWLDAIAYRGYKFVGVVMTMILGLLMHTLYYPALLYSATAMGIFLMRSHRRIILPRDTDMMQSKDLARRNAFLLFISVLQYPIYWLLVPRVRT